MITSEKPKCYLCGSTEVVDFFEMHKIPTQDGIMADSYETAINSPLGDINLRYCNTCDYVGNEGHDMSKIQFEQYDFKLDHSQIFQEYLDDLSHKLIDRHHLEGKTILDLGCGAGNFLRTICKAGNCKGIGIDPAFKNEDSTVPPITFIKDYYDRRYHHLKVDLVTCRLVLDLLGDPISLIETLRQNLDNSPDTIVFFEVPGSHYTLNEQIIWNIVYERRSWFNEDSFRYLFELCGFHVIDVGHSWNDELLWIEAKPQKKYSKPKARSLQETRKVISGFSNAFNNICQQSLQKLSAINNNETTTVAWGAGARAITFFNLYQISESIAYIADINPLRQGKFLPGTGQKIIAPDLLKEIDPELIIITNPTYQTEIKNHAKMIGLKSKFWVL